MKYIKVLCLFGVLFLISCSNSNESSGNSQKKSDCDTLLMNRKVIEAKMAVYGVNESLYPILDSVIEAEMLCPFYDECKSGFVFTTTTDSGFYRIEINSINVYNYDYKKCFGVFIYNDHRFICEGTSVESLLTKTAEELVIKYWEIDRSKWKPETDDRYTTWYFEYLNNKLLYKGHHLCMRKE
jgi:hypothetical protein